MTKNSVTVLSMKLIHYCLAGAGLLLEVAD